MLVDEVTIFVRGGKGGDGCVSFRREKYVPKGGPDGGDGGHGGSVYLVAKHGVDTLLDLAGKHHWHAENGQPGSGNNREGRRGRHLVVAVPTGTLVYDAETGILLKDMVEDGTRIRVARGGHGGYGNLHFVSSTNQAPRESIPGQAGRQRTLRLQLKLIADVGLVGLPNAGKSTLLSRLSRARPKIAAYPFTTLEPNLGVMELSNYRRLVLADIPGLIEGAHKGLGLGDAFLRHIERTRVIVHLIDICPTEGGPDPAKAYSIIRTELAAYSPQLAQRREIIVANKMDLTDADAHLADLRRALRAASEPRPAGRGQDTTSEPHPAGSGSQIAATDVEIHGISGVSGRGIRELAEVLWRVVDEARQEEAALAAAAAEKELIDISRVTAGPSTTGRSPFAGDAALSTLGATPHPSTAGSGEGRTFPGPPPATSASDDDDDDDINDLGDLDQSEILDAPVADALPAGDEKEPS